MDKITNLIHEYIEDNGGSSLNENFLKDAFIKLFKNSFIWINKQIFGPEMGKLLDMYINGSLQIKKNFQAQLDKMSTIDLDEEFLTKYTLKFIDALKENANLAFVKNI